MAELNLTRIFSTFLEIFSFSEFFYRTILIEDEKNQNKTKVFKKRSKNSKKVENIICNFLDYISMKVSEIKSLRFAHLT